MFTGLIETVGTILFLDATSATIEADFASQLRIGDSVCVSGTCLTVTRVTPNSFTVDISAETFKISNWNSKKIGQKVNLERAMPLGARLDGHFVYGHVDTVSKVVNIQKTSDFAMLTIQLPKEYSNLVVNKGSIAVDGISLTIANVSESIFDIAVIPTTLACTTLNECKVGDIVNIEFDMIAKYIEKNLSLYHNKSKISIEFLEENGFLS